MFKLTRLLIYANTGYGDKPTTYPAKVEFEGEGNEITLTLPDELSRRVLEICADMIREKGGELAANLSVALPLHPAAPQLEDKS